MTGRPPSPHRPRWAGYRDERLLDVAFADLGVSLADTWVAERVERLYAELAARGLRVRPHVWLSTEWFSPRRVPGIAVPFYLAHPRLMRLERRQTGEVEGGTRKECLMILRHEAGHVVQHGFRLHRLRRWQQLFGSTRRPYPDVYRPNPKSRRFVQHLRLYYAQSHPDEDFAETFAVWLAPRGDWRTRYAGWPALEKLLYVDELMRSLAGRAPLLTSRRRVEPIERDRRTLREHYVERRRAQQRQAPGAYDRQLLELFSAGGGGEKAAAFLTRHRAAIRRLVARWTGEHRFSLEQVLDDLVRRSRELDLRVRRADEALVTDAALLLAVATVHHLYRRPDRVAL